MTNAPSKLPFAVSVPPECWTVPAAAVLAKKPEPTTNAPVDATVIAALSRIINVPVAGVAALPVSPTLRSLVTLTEPSPETMIVASSPATFPAVRFPPVEKAPVICSVPVRAETSPVKVSVPSRLSRP